MKTPGTRRDESRVAVSGGGDAIKVAARVRPFLPRENGEECVVSMEGPTTILTSPTDGRQKKFNFDYSYWSVNKDDAHFADQQTVFEDLGKTLVENVLEGYNACLFAYGQTGAGKSYTITGYGEEKGLLPLVCTELFQVTEKDRKAMKGDGEAQDQKQKEGAAPSGPDGSASAAEAGGASASDGKGEEGGKAAQGAGQGGGGPEGEASSSSSSSSAEKGAPAGGKEKDGGEKGKSGGPEGIEYRFQVSYLEIYNERIRDLLVPPDAPPVELDVHKHPTFGIYIPNLSEHVVDSLPGIMSLLDFGSKARTVASTSMNATSSRSHSVFSIVIHQVPKKKLQAQQQQQTPSIEPRKSVRATRSATIGLSVSAGSVSAGGAAASQPPSAAALLNQLGGGCAKVARLNVVDLAGSERQEKTQSVGGRLREAGQINVSLTQLGLVISRLASGAKNQHVPFRNSKLTYLLSESLSGNSKTAMIAAISPASSNFDETLSTLRFATSVKRCKTFAKVNLDETDAIVKQLQEEISRLKQQLLEEGGAPRSQRRRSLLMSSRELEAAEAELREKTDLIGRLQTSWQQAVEKSEKMKEQRERALEDLGLSNRELFSAIGMDKTLPYLMNMSEDPLLSGCLMYFLQERQEQKRQLMTKSKEEQRKMLVSMDSTKRKRVTAILAANTSEKMMAFLKRQASSCKTKGKKDGEGSAFDSAVKLAEKAKRKSKMIQKLNLGGPSRAKSLEVSSASVNRADSVQKKRFSKSKTGVLGSRATVAAGTVVAGASQALESGGGDGDGEDRQSGGGESEAEEEEEESFGFSSDEDSSSLSGGRSKKGEGEGEEGGARTGSKKDLCPESHSFDESFDMDAQGGGTARESKGELARNRTLETIQNLLDLQDDDPSSFDEFGDDDDCTQELAEFLDEDSETFNHARAFLKDLQFRMGQEKAREFVRQFREVSPLVDEANEITAEMRPYEHLRFSVEITTDISTWEIDDPGGRMFPDVRGLIEDHENKAIPRPDSAADSIFSPLEMADGSALFFPFCLSSACDLTSSQLSFLPIFLDFRGCERTHRITGAGHDQFSSPGGVTVPPLISRLVLSTLSPPPCSLLIPLCSPPLPIGGGRGGGVSSALRTPELKGRSGGSSSRARSAPPTRDRERGAQIPALTIGEDRGGARPPPLDLSGLAGGEVDNRVTNTKEDPGELSRTSSWKTVTFEVPERAQSASPREHSTPSPQQLLANMRASSPLVLPASVATPPTPNLLPRSRSERSLGLSRAETETQLALALSALHDEIEVTSEAGDDPPERSQSWSGGGGREARRGTPIGELSSPTTIRMPKRNVSEDEAEEDQGSEGRTPPAGGRNRQARSSSLSDRHGWTVLNVWEVQKFKERLQLMRQLYASWADSGHREGVEFCIDVERDPWVDLSPDDIRLLEIKWHNQFEEALDEERREHKARAEEVQRLVVAIEQELEDATGRYDDKKRQLEDLRAEFEKLKSIKGETDGQLSAASSRVTALEKDIETFQKEMRESLGEAFAAALTEGDSPLDSGSASSSSFKGKQTTEGSQQSGGNASAASQVPGGSGTAQSLPALLTEVRSRLKKQKDEMESLQEEIAGKTKELERVKQEKADETSSLKNEMENERERAEKLLEETEDSLKKREEAALADARKAREELSAYRRQASLEKVDLEEQKRKALDEKEEETVRVRPTHKEREQQLEKRATGLERKLEEQTEESRKAKTAWQQREKELEKEAQEFREKLKEDLKTAEEQKEKEAAGKKDLAARLEIAETQLQKSEELLAASREENARITEEGETLRNRLAKAATETEELRTAVARAAGKAERSLEETARAQKKLEALEKETAEETSRLSAEVGKLKEERDTLKEKGKELLAKLEEAETGATSLENRTTSVAAQAQTWQTEVSELQSALQEVRKALGEKETELSKKSAEVKAAAEENERLESRLTTLKKEAEEEAERMKGQLEMREGARREIAQLLEDERAERRKRDETLQSQLQKSDDLIGRLRTEKSELEKECEKLKAEGREAEVAARSLQRESEKVRGAATARADRLQESIDSLRAERDSALEKIATLEANHLKETAALASQQTANNEKASMLEAKVATLSEKLQEETETKNALSERLAALSAGAAEREEEGRLMKERVSLLQQERGELQEALQESRREMRTLKSEVSAEKEAFESRRVAELQEAITKADASLKEKETSIETLRESLQEERQARIALSAEAQELRALYMKSAGASEESALSLARLMEEMRTREAENRNQLEEKMSLVLKAKEETAEASKDLAVAREQLESLRGRVEELRQTETELRRLAAESEERASALSARLQASEKDRELASKEVALKREAGEAEASAAAARREEQHREAMEEKNQKISTLRQEIRALEEAVAESAARVESLREEKRQEADQKREALEREKEATQALQEAAKAAKKTEERNNEAHQKALAEERAAKAALSAEIAEMKRLLKEGSESRGEVEAEMRRMAFEALSKQSDAAGQQESLTKTIASLSSDLAAAQAEAATLRGDVKRLEDAVAQKSEQAATAVGEAASLRRVNAEHESSLRDLRYLTEREVEAVKRRLDAQTAEFEIERQKERAERQKNEAEERIMRERLQEQIRLLKAGRDTEGRSVQSKLEAEEERRRQAEQRVKKLESDFATLQAESLRRLETAGGAERVLETKEKELQKERREREAVEEELTTLRERLQRTEGRLMEEVSSSRKERERLLSKLEEAEKKSSEASMETRRQLEQARKDAEARVAELKEAGGKGAEVAARSAAEKLGEVKEELMQTKARLQSEIERLKIAHEKERKRAGEAERALETATASNQMRENDETHRLVLLLRLETLRLETVDRCKDEEIVQADTRMLKRMAEREREQLQRLLKQEREGAKAREGRLESGNRELRALAEALGGQLERLVAQSTESSDQRESARTEMEKERAGLLQEKTALRLKLEAVENECVSLRTETASLKEKEQSIARLSVERLAELRSANRRLHAELSQARSLSHRKTLEAAEAVKKGEWAQDRVREAARIASDREAAVAALSSEREENVALRERLRAVEGRLEESSSQAKKDRETAASLLRQRAEEQVLLASALADLKRELPAALQKALEEATEADGDPPTSPKQTDANVNPENAGAKHQRHEEESSKTTAPQRGTKDQKRERDGPPEESGSDSVTPTGSGSFNAWLHDVVKDVCRRTVGVRPKQSAAVLAELTEQDRKRTDRERARDKEIAHLSATACFLRQRETDLVTRLQAAEKGCCVLKDLSDKMATQSGQAVSHSKHLARLLQLLLSKSSRGVMEGLPAQLAEAVLQQPDITTRPGDELELRRLREENSTLRETLELAASGQPAGVNMNVQAQSPARGGAAGSFAMSGRQTTEESDGVRVVHLGVDSSNDQQDGGQGLNLEQRLFSFGGMKESGPVPRTRKEFLSESQQEEGGREGGTSVIPHADEEKEPALPSYSQWDPDLINLKVLVEIPRVRTSPSSPPSPFRTDQRLPPSAYIPGRGPSTAGGRGAASPPSQQTSPRGRYSPPPCCLVTCGGNRSHPPSPAYRQSHPPTGEERPQAQPPTEAPERNVPRRGPPPNSSSSSSRPTQPPPSVQLGEVGTRGGGASLRGGGYAQREASRTAAHTMAPPSGITPEGAQQEGRGGTSRAQRVCVRTGTASRGPSRGGAATARAPSSAGKATTGRRSGGGGVSDGRGKSGRDT
uniref:Kinesin motor domain-containing protein n=1 Tax=Chromera velia CCMP2878 TaxID=1169474 RepID=A0A0G4HP77_9ALVE|eukprot:Cvel_1209.t1-p1 / transcript=Cvel_1209.t1 / gene=Cvel_1209 / organism=Chromera_velia_CCMP2878 / gene_product=Kinesin-related protein 1, putative / transcript_product=Kinesin-related protein 1, putative / location=Cvel_scaffold40:59354-85467(+) / protein_length=3711 / sequence_SO=supercontig / SO=protein_coding / is_pseudo=false